MELSLDNEIAKVYGFNLALCTTKQIGSGHINRTYLLTTQHEKQYILQNINTYVFKDPQAIANNIDLVSKALSAIAPDYLFPAPLPTIDGNLMFKHKDEYWRLLPYIPNSVAFDTLTDPKQAYEAAKQFGRLSRLLKDFDTKTLKATIPGFHDIVWRHEQFIEAISQSTESLKINAAKEIEHAKQYDFIVTYFQSFEKANDFPSRVMHHDTKISNVLLKQNTFEGICVIDLDTLMPGKFISDLGDMMRTYLCAYSENEKDLSLIKIRLPYFEATVKGYLSEMGSILSDLEKDLILFSGKYIIYMQALRFLTDYLNGSIYYPISYQTQNLDRAKNQFKLLEELFENEKTLQGIIDESLQA